MALKIGIFSPSAPVPLEELKKGIARLERETSARLFVHPQTLKQWKVFAGTDEERRAAFLDLVDDPELDVIWAARGGYGAFRLIEPLLQRKPPRRPKTLVGFSDITALLEFVRTHWGWRSIHAPMPGGPAFNQMPKKEFQFMMGLVQGHSSPRSFRVKSLLSGKAVSGPLVGGNLCVLSTLVGTPFQPDFRGKILFLEEVDEAPYRIDRMLHQMRAAQFFRGVKAIVLGTFTNCEDRTFQVSGPLLRGKPTEVPLRPVMSDSVSRRFLFEELGKSLKIPVAYGLPVGHGKKGYVPLELGAWATLRGETLTV